MGTKDLFAEESHSKYWICQKQAELNSQWASERLARLQEQNANGRDAFSISIEAFKESLLGRPGRRHIIAKQESLPQTPETLDTETKSVADSPRYSPSVPTTPPHARLCAELKTSEPKRPEPTVQLPPL